MSRSKGDSSCHIPSGKYRENYDQMMWDSQKEEIERQERKSDMIDEDLRDGTLPKCR